MSASCADVAIVGLGPVGAVLGNLLGQAGLDVAIFEREADIVPIPRAVAFDGEVMRVYQAIGLADVLEPFLRPSTGGQYIGPTGEVLLRRDGATEEGAQGWRSHYNFHQPVLERTLRQGLARYPNVAVRLRHDVFAVDEQGDRVTLRVEDMATGRLFSQEAHYVVGCDGARSLIRRLIGGGFTDLGLHEPWVVADFTLKHDMPDLPDRSTQFCDRAYPVTYVRVVDNRRRWEFKLPPGTARPDSANAANVWKLVSRWITPDDAILERSALYTFHSLIAERWQAGRLIVAGDAAHQTPPFMGQGLCTGIRDIANLAWKLERIVRYGAPDALLDTYGPERTPHSTAFIQMAVDLGRILGATNADEMRALAEEITRGGGTLTYPSPSLGPGLHGAGAEAGFVAPQPRLSDGSRLDDAVGYRFALVGTARGLKAIDSDTRETLASLGVTNVEASGAVVDWLAEADAETILLRPDRYILGAFADAAALAKFLVGLPAELGTRSSGERT